MGRLRFIDGLRGVAALAVALLHIFGTSPVRPFMPRAIGAVLLHGYLGVAIFFVLSGFVIAWSLDGWRVSGALFGRFMARRLMRLHPPYVASMGLAILVVALSNWLLRDRVLPYPSAGAISAHFFYLEDILGFPKMNDVYWTLCLEIQFYLLFVGLLFVAQRARAREGKRRLLSSLQWWVFGPVTVYGFALIAGFAAEPLRGLCFSSWPLFFGGVLLCWLVRGGVTAGSVAAYGVLLAVSALWRPDLMVLVGVATIGYVWLCLRRPSYGRWLESEPLQYLGRISYSLYLVHPFFGQRVTNLGSRLLGSSEGASWILFFFAIGCAIAGAHLFWRFVEVPCIAWSRKIGLVKNGEFAATDTRVATNVSD